MGLTEHNSDPKSEHEARNFKGFPYVFCKTFNHVDYVSAADLPGFYLTTYLSLNLLPALEVI